MSNVLRMVFISLLVFVFIGCGDSSDDSNQASSNANQKYIIKNNANTALLGALKDANVTAYKFSDSNTAIEQTTTNDVGEFALSLNGVESDELVIVKVQGGYDIDADDDGYIDTTPTKNNGTITSVAKAIEFKNQSIKVSLLSDVVYRFTKDMINETTEEDYQSIMDYVAKKLVLDEKNINIISSFKPTSQEDRNKLAFKFDDILDSSKTKLLQYYHDGNDTIINDELSLVLNSILSMNNALYKSLKKSVKVKLATPTNSDVNSSNSNIYYNYSTKSGNLVSFIKKDSNITLSATVQGKNKIVGWRGCNKISNDKKTCYINNIQEDKLIVPVVVPDEIVMNPNITFRNLTGSLISISGDDYTIQSNDSSMQTKLSNVSVDDVIISQIEPVFFKQVVSATKINSSKYIYKTKFIPLEEVVNRGYLL